MVLNKPLVNDEVYEFLGKRPVLDGLEKFINSKCFCYATSLRLLHKLVPDVDTGTDFILSCLFVSEMGLFVLLSDKTIFDCEMVLILLN